MPMRHILSCCVRLGALLAALAVPVAAREGRFALDDLDLVLHLSDGTVLRGEALIGLSLVTAVGPNEFEIRIDDIVREGRLAHRGIAFDNALGELLRAGEVRACTIKRDNNHTYEGFERVYGNRQNDKTD